MLKEIMESFIDRGKSTILINKFTNKSSNDQYVYYIDIFWLNNYQNLLHFIRGWDNGEFTQFQEPILFHMVMWDSNQQKDSSFHFKHLEPTNKKNPQNHNYHDLAADEEEDEEEADEVLPMYLCRKWLRLKTTPQPMAGSMLMKPSRFIWHSEGKTHPSMMTS